MTDREYALCVYQLVFKVQDDDDANIRGILSALSTLPDRERIALESRHRYGNKFEQVGMDAGGISKTQASKAVDKALSKLRYTTRSKSLSITRMEKDKEYYVRLIDETRDDAREMKRLLGILSYSSPLREELKPSLEKFTLQLFDLQLSTKTKNTLYNARIDNIALILAMSTFDELIRIRNMGPTCAFEVINTMRDMGFIEWADLIMQSVPKEVCS